MASYTCEEITQAPKPDFYHLHHLLKSSYGITQACLKELTGYEDCNFLLYDMISENGGPTRAVLKVTNPIEAKSDKNIDFQTTICDILNENGIPCPRTIKRLDGRDWSWEVVADGVQLPVRLFEVLPGENLENFKFEPELVQQIGELLARFHVVADNSKLSVDHIPYIAVEHRQSILKEMELQLKASLISMDNAQLIMDCFAEFDDRIGKHPEHHERGLIHSDFNETNILVCEENGEMKITGLLDFGDVHHSFRIVDIASAVLYLHLCDKLSQGVEILTKNILEGYRKVREVPDCTYLVTAMKARLSCSLIYGLRTARMNSRSEDMEYVLRTQRNGWKVLKELHVGRFEIKKIASRDIF